MAAALQHLIDHCHRRVSATRADAELLRAWLVERHDDAFRALVERHGAMVLGVCRRRLGDAHAAEDAFQATFLLLSRSARSIRRPESLAAWLHRTAVRVCGRARAAVRRRQAREVPLGDEALAENAAARSTADVLAALEEEVERLPERYRSALLLCYWQELTQAEAARRLGCSDGAVKSRLERGRQRLAARLRQRGFHGGALLAAALGAAGVPRELLARTVALATTRAAVPRSVAALTTAGVGLKVWLSAAALVTFAAVTLGVSATWERSRAEAAPAIEERKPAAEPLPAGAVGRIGSSRLRHAGEVTAVAFSRDGKWLASASPDAVDATVRVWDLATGAEKRRVPIEAAGAVDQEARFRPVAVAFSGDGKELRVIDRESYRVIDLATGKQLLQRRFYDRPPPQAWDPAEVFGASLSPDGGTYAAVRRSGDLILGDTASGKVRLTIARGYEVEPNRSYSHVSIVFSQDGQRVCIPTASAGMKVFHAGTGNAVGSIPLADSAIWASDFLNGGKEFAYLARDGKQFVVRVVAVADGKRLRQFAMEWGANCLAVSPDETMVAVGNTQRPYVRLLDAASGKEVRRLPRPLSSLRLAFSPDGSLLANLAYSSGSLTLLDVATGNRHPASADGVWFGRGFDRDGRLAVGRDRLMQITDWRSGRTYGEFPLWEAPGTAITYSPDRRLKAYHDRTKAEDWKPEDGFPITIRETAGNKEVARLVGTTEYPLHMAFSHDARRLVTVCQDDVVRVWDLASKKVLWTEKQPPQSFRYVGMGTPHLSADDRRLAILCAKSDAEAVIRVLDTGTKTRVGEIAVPYLFFGGISLSSDGKLVAGGGNERAPEAADRDAVFLWDVDSGKVVHKLKGHKLGRITCEFAPDGRSLLTVDATGTIRVWETLTGQERLRITGHRGAAIAGFSPDSALIAASSNELPLVVWDNYALTHAPRPDQPLDPAAAWQALGDANAGKAFAAMRQLRAAPEKAVALLRENLKPAAKVDADTMRKWIRELDDDRFAAREAAERELAKVAERASVLMRDALDRAPSAEMRKRLKRLLQVLDKPTAEHLREQRAIELLERLGTGEALQFLGTVAAGDSGAALTRAAKASVSRLKPR